MDETVLYVGGDPENVQVTPEAPVETPVETPVEEPTPAPETPAE